ncbi:MAG: hypothetical protein AAF901_04140 [Bacteroidota bacterium]
MSKILISVLLSLLSMSTSVAHNPLTSRFELRASLEEGAILDIYLTQAGLHSALVKQHPEVNLKDISLDSYKEMVVDYLKRHIHLSADCVPLEIGQGAIKLGNHQTDLKFHVPKYPQFLEQLDVKINAFEENGLHVNVFWWYTSEKSTKVILSRDNDFTSSFTRGNDKLYSDESGFFTSFGVVFLIIVLLMATLLTHIYFTKMVFLNK